MNNNDEMEKYLRHFSPRPVPQEVKERIFRNATRLAADRRILTPGLRFLFIGAVIVGSLSVLLDVCLVRRQQQVLAAELNLPSSPLLRPSLDIEKRISEMLLEFPDVKHLPRTWLQWALSYERKEDFPMGLSPSEIKEKIHENKN